MLAPSREPVRDAPGEIERGLLGPRARPGSHHLDGLRPLPAHRDVEARVLGVQGEAREEVGGVRLQGPGVRPELQPRARGLAAVPRRRHLVHDEGLPDLLGRDLTKGLPAERLRERRLEAKRPLKRPHRPLVGVFGPRSQDLGQGAREGDGHLGGQCGEGQGEAPQGPLPVHPEPLDVGHEGGPCPLDLHAGVRARALHPLRDLLHGPPGKVPVVGHVGLDGEAAGEPSGEPLLQARQGPAVAPDEVGPPSALAHVEVDAQVAAAVLETPGPLASLPRRARGRREPVDGEAAAPGLCADPFHRLQGPHPPHRHVHHVDAGVDAAARRPLVERDRRREERPHQEEPEERHAQHPKGGRDLPRGSPRGR